MRYHRIVMSDLIIYASIVRAQNGKHFHRISATPKTGSPIILEWEFPVEMNSFSEALELLGFPLVQQGPIIDLTQKGILPLGERTISEEIIDKISKLARDAS